MSARDGKLAGGDPTLTALLTWRNGGARVHARAVLSLQVLQVAGGTRRRDRALHRRRTEPREVDAYAYDYVKHFLWARRAGASMERPHARAGELCSATEQSCGQ